MTDTSTTTTTPDGTKVKREPSPRDVDYTLEVFDGELPDRPERSSPLEEALRQVIANEAAHGKWVCIGRYKVLSAGTAAKHQLELRHGKSGAVEGWDFQTRRVNDPDGTPRQGVFVKYSPDKIVQGAAEQHKVEMDKRKAELKAKRDAKKAAEATGNTQAPAPAPSPTANNDQAPPPPPPPPAPGQKTGSEQDKAARAAANKG